MIAKVRALITSVVILLIVISCENEPIGDSITDLNFAPSTRILEVGMTDTLKLLVQPENAADREFIWSSSNPSIAKVNPQGVVTGISPGLSIITVTTKDNKYAATDTVHVIRWTFYYMENVHHRPIVVDSFNNVWCGGMKLTRIINNSPAVYPDIERISAIASNNTKNVWFGTWESGVWKFDDTNWVKYTKTNDDLPFSSVNYSAMAFDKQDNLWIGTSEGTLGSGLAMYNGNQWSVFNSDSGLINNAVKSIAIDSQNNKWFVVNKGISKFDGFNWISYESENTGMDLIDHVFSIAIDAEDNKWFGSYKGALKFDGTIWTVFNTSNSGLGWNYINAIAIDNDDNKWFATESGISRFDGKDWINYSSDIDKEFPVYNCRSIAIDSNGSKWIGTSYGVIKLEN